VQFRCRDQLECHRVCSIQLGASPKHATRFAFPLQVRKNWGMQGSSRSVRQLLDAEEFCRHLVKPDSVHAFLAHHRSQLFPDELFEDLIPSGRGRPSVPANKIAPVMVLQSLEGLSDREACRALQCDISWKVACGLGLTDEAFHPTVFVLWRNKLRASERPERIFEAMRVVVDESDVIAIGSRAGTGQRSSRDGYRFWHTAHGPVIARRGAQPFLR
jgi:transposase